MNSDHMDETCEDRLEIRCERLEKLCQKILDPENQPPQISIEDAWAEFKEIRK